MVATRYVDFSAANNGDGTTPAQAGSPGGAGAFNTLVAATTTTGDTFWLRRAGTLTLAAVLNMTVANVTYIGWPISTDSDFGSRPGAGTAQGWDSDSTAVLPTISNTGANNFDVTTNAGQTFKRIKFNWSGSANGTLPTVACSFHYCQWVHSGGSAAINLSHTTGIVLFNQCTVTVSSASTDGILYNAAGFLQLIDVTITKSNTGAGKACLNLGSLTGGGEFVRCSFIFSGLLNVPLRCLNVSGNTPTANAPLVFVDCIVDNSVNSGAAGGEAAVALLGRAVVRNMSVKGSGVVISIAAQIPLSYPIHFSKIQQTYPMPNGALDLSGSGVGQIPVYVGSFIPLPGNTSDDLSVNTTGGPLMVMQHAVFAHPKRTNPQLGSTGAVQNGLYLASRNGLLGHFGMAQSRSRVRSNQVARSGGSAFSYKLEFDKITVVAGSGGTTTPILLMLGSPGQDAVFVNLPNNSQTVTVFGAYRGYTTVPTADDIWIEVMSLDGSGTSWVTTSSRAGNEVAQVALASDSSSWSGDGVLTAFKISVPIAQVATNPNWNIIRVRATKPMTGNLTGFGETYDVAGAIYIDPVPVVT